jgi:hypothetical protein
VIKNLSLEAIQLCDRDGKSGGDPEERGQARAKAPWPLRPRRRRPLRSSRGRRRLLSSPLPVCESGRCGPHVRPFTPETKNPGLAPGPSHPRATSVPSTPAWEPLAVARVRCCQDRALAIFAAVRVSSVSPHPKGRCPRHHRHTRTR